MSKLTQIEQLQEVERIISTDKKIPVTILGKTYNIRQCSNKVELKIQYLLLESYAMEKRANKEEMSLSQAKKLQRRLRNIHSKQAAWYLIGNWGLVIPFLHSFVTWRLNWKTSEFTFNIISAAQGGAQKGFFTLNWENSKAQLKQYMNGLLQGEVLLNQRVESVEMMIKEDFPTSQDNK